MNLVIRNAHVRGHQQPVDIAIEGERISAVGPKVPNKAAQELDAAGSLVLPGLFNLHFHADKCRLGEVMRPNQSGTLPETIDITKRRGIARVKELLARGANVVTSQDDVNDPYYPFGKPDPLECASISRMWRS